ncbi:MAG: metallophosphoesterase N-terminal domain-containing protein [Pirellulaceae bacterium]
MTRRRVFCAVAMCVTMLGFVFTAGADERVSRLRGRVLGDGQPLAGVSVSDGHRVVHTDQSGNYQLPIDEKSGHFVFVTLPRSYWSEDFHLPLETAIQRDSVDFALSRVEQSDRCDFVFLTDMHLERPEIGGAKLNATLAEINRLTPKPSFLLFQGDICLQSGSGDLYAECLETADMPVRHGAGNHEMMLRHENPRDDFEHRFGPTYYSFDWGPLHCIVLDGNKPIPGETGWQAVHGAVEGGELEWLKADLADQPKGKPIVVSVHIPIVSSYPERRLTSPKNAPYWEMTNRELLTDLLTRHGVRLVLQGHMHENERTTIGGVEYVSSISISGGWWKAGEGFERGVDNCPRGYRIVSVDGETITHRYQSSAESRVTRPGEYYGLDKPLPAGKETAFVFNCYDAPNEATAVARMDDGPWQPMPAFAAPSSATKGLTMAHHYRLIADTTEMTPGRHTITARVTFPDKTTTQATSPFEIAR